MQTFKFDLRLQATVIVPEKFLEETLAAVNADDATPFLLRLRNEFNERIADLTHDDTAAYSAACDELVAAVLTNAIRKSVQANLAMTLAQAEIGSRVSPVEVLGLEYVQPRVDSKRVAAPKVAAIAGNLEHLSQEAVARELEEALGEQAEHEGRAE